MARSAGGAPITEDLTFEQAVLRMHKAEFEAAYYHGALTRLASSEAFVRPTVIEGPLAEEVRARMQFASEALAKRAAVKGVSK